MTKPCCTSETETGSGHNKDQHCSIGQQQSAAATSCCGTHESEAVEQSTPASCCDTDASKRDWLLIAGISIVVGALSLYWLNRSTGLPMPEWLGAFCASVTHTLHTMWWGVAVGIVFLAILGQVPKELVTRLMGTGRGFIGILRATAAGVLLDLCSHGILMVGTKLYERGASAGQVIAFLVASPWNSLSLTLILVALVGWKLTLVYLVLSAVVAVISGMVFDRLVARGVLPSNPNTVVSQSSTPFLASAREQWQASRWDVKRVQSAALQGLKDSRMVIRWLFVGVIIAAAMQVFISPEDYAYWFGPTIVGLAVTTVAATIIEVCSEGSTPIAADIANQANAPGNGFAFLMAGIATDYTEVVVLKDMSRSWKFALFLPVVTLPQVLVLAMVLNQFS
ncbi:ATPase [Alteromonas aestuariivivens]|uniref:ATPase n=1 Tax=Alteromonas aestuariivivens TaxID=1938339 RepID=A0A3D8M349_9ALTE|nr:permease [Alteromonas aestuariivivens]RDV24143.1 ATPase [Alteromonas aestuariivivens]